MRSLIFLLLLSGPPAQVSPDVQATFVAWGESRESAAYPVATLEFHNSTQKTCTVERYAIHWSEGSYEGTPTDLKLAPGKTVRREVKLTTYATPSDKTAVVQVWKTSCK